MRLYTLDGRFNLCGERVREARIKAGMSQDTLAAKLQLAGLQSGQLAVSSIEARGAGHRTAGHRRCDGRQHGLAAGKRIDLSAARQGGLF